MVKTKKIIWKKQLQVLLVFDFFPNFLVRLPPTESLRSLDLYISGLILSPWRCSKRRILPIDSGLFQEKSGGVLKFNNRSQDSKKVFKKQFFQHPPQKKIKFYNGDSAIRLKTNIPSYTVSLLQMCCFFALIVFRRRKADACSLLSGLTKNQSAENPLETVFRWRYIHCRNGVPHDYLLEQEHV